MPSARHTPYFVAHGIAYEAVPCDNGKWRAKIHWPGSNAIVYPSEFNLPDQAMLFARQMLEEIVALANARATEAAK